MEEEIEETIPFLDTLIHREDTSASFSVYRKPTHKDDYVHFFSGHDMRTKRGIVIGFYLRALRICDSDFLEGEINYINESFEKLMYPATVLKECQRKARSIHQRKDKKMKPDLYVVGPPNEGAEHIQKSMGRSVSIISKCGTRILDITRKRKPTVPTSTSVVYEIPCGDCPKVYVGETHLGLEKRLQDHRRDLKRNVETNALVKHRESTSHRINLTGARVIESCPNKSMRRLKESVHIALTNNFNIQKSSHKISKFVCQCIGDGIT